MALLEILKIDLRPAQLAGDSNPVTPVAVESFEGNFVICAETNLFGTVAE